MELENDLLLKIAVIGLGQMGSAAAKRLINCGIDVAGFDPMVTVENREISKENNPLDAILSSDGVMLWLPSSNEVRDLVKSLPVRDETSTGSGIIVDCTSGDPRESKCVSQEAGAKGYYYVDVGVSGGPVGALVGNLTMMIGGSKGERRLVDLLVELIGDPGKTYWFQKRGAGHLVKAICNGICAANMVIAGEALQVLFEEGLDKEYVVGAVGSSAGASAVININYKGVIKEQYTGKFSIGLMRKDLCIAKSILAKQGSNLHELLIAIDRWIDEGENLNSDDDFNKVAKALLGNT